MKTKLVRKHNGSLTLRLCVDHSGCRRKGARGGAVGGRLEGTWNMQITLNDCSGHVIRSFPTLVAFSGGRHLDRGERRYSPGSETGGKGVWSHTTDSTYAFRFKDFTFNVQNVFTGWSIISGETTVDATGNANAGPATVEVYDASGVLVATLCADAVGTRFEL